MATNDFDPDYDYEGYDDYDPFGDYDFEFGEMEVY